MCYTGKCKYENYMGDCNIRNYNIKKGLPIGTLPEDAGCAIADMEIEKTNDKIFWETKK